MQVKEQGGTAMNSVISQGTATTQHAWQYVKVCKFRAVSGQPPQGYRKGDHEMIDREVVDQASRTRSELTACLVTITNDSQLALLLSVV